MESFDLILAMEPEVIRWIRRISGSRFDAEKVKLFMDISRPGEELEVPDPWYGGESGYHEVFQLLDEGCALLVSQLTDRS